MNDLGSRIIQMHLSLSKADNLIDRVDPFWGTIFNPLLRAKYNHVAWDLRRKLEAASKTFNNEVKVKLGFNSDYHVSMAGAMVLMGKALAKNRYAYDFETSVDPYGIPDWRKGLVFPELGMISPMINPRERAFRDMKTFEGLGMSKEKPFAEGLTPRLLPEKAASLIGKIVLTPHQTDVADYFIGIDPAYGPSISRVIKYQNGVYTDISSIEPRKKRHEHIDDAIIEMYGVLKLGYEKTKRKKH